jgi:hypothetical protein
LVSDVRRAHGNKTDQQSRMSPSFSGSSRNVDVTRLPNRVDPRIAEGLAVI